MSENLLQNVTSQSSGAELTSLKKHNHLDFLNRQSPGILPPTITTWMRNCSFSSVGSAALRGTSPGTAGKARCSCLYRILQARRAPLSLTPGFTHKSLHGDPEVLHRTTQNKHILPAIKKTRISWKESSGGP